MIEEHSAENGAQSARLHPQVALWIARGFLVLAFAVPAALLLTPPKGQPGSRTLPEKAFEPNARPIAPPSLIQVSTGAAKAAADDGTEEALPQRRLQSGLHGSPRLGSASLPATVAEPEPATLRDRPAPLMRPIPTRGHEAGTSASSGPEPGGSQRVAAVEVGSDRAEAQPRERSSGMLDVRTEPASRRAASDAAPDAPLATAAAVAPGHERLKKAQRRTASTRHGSRYQPFETTRRITKGIGSGLNRAANGAKRFFAKIF